MFNEYVVSCPSGVTAGKGWLDGWLALAQFFTPPRRSTSTSRSPGWLLRKINGFSREK